MSLYGGIDLHANNSVVVLLNDQDQVIYQKRLPNALSTILEALAPYSSEIEGFVVESTYNWYWLVDGLMEAGYRVHLANPAAIQQYSGLKYTNDHSDARWLAHLLRLGVLPQGYIYPKAERAVRDLWFCRKLSFEAICGMVSPSNPCCQGGERRWRSASKGPTSHQTLF